MNSPALHPNIWGENISLAAVAGCKDLNVLSQKASDTFVGDFPAADAVKVAARASHADREGCLGSGCGVGWSVLGHGHG